MNVEKNYNHKFPWIKEAVLHDETHDEVYVASSGLIIMQNGIMCFSDEELRREVITR